MTQVTKFDPNCPVSLHFDGRGYFAWYLAAKVISRDERKYESA